ncbi:MAG: alcohol dehydrogenase catalytic domain-containing protein [Rhizobiales bacterium]|nr:alcohol dehydrogenase catalytic domain-containing protein [Hyphomicrobiales bacterium]
MRAARLYGIGDLRVEAVPEPASPAGDDVLIKVLAAGICGSDLHNFKTGQWLSRKPSTPGHELAGEVIAVGPDVRKFRSGDRVVADSRVACGTCPSCRRASPNLCRKLGFVGEVCDGGFAEMIVLPESIVLPADPALSPAIAAMAEPLAVALHTVNRLAPERGEPILIAGAGPIGGLVALVLAREGFGPVSILDRNEARRQLVAEVTGASPATLDDAPSTRFAVDATGSVAVAATLAARAASGSRIVLVGIFHENLTIDPNLIVEREIDLIGCGAFAGELPVAIERLPAYAADLASYIEGPIRLADVPGAYQDLINGKAIRLKTIIDPALA